MNSKLCKILRGQARGMTTGLPERDLLANYGKDANGRPCTSAVNDPATTRGVYRAMKKGAS